MTKITTGILELKPHIVGAKLALGLMATLTVFLIPSLIVLATA